MDVVLEKPGCTWQSAFIRMLPDIQQRLQRMFRNLDAEAREDAVYEAVVHSLLAYLRLHEQGNQEVASPSTLTWYAVLQVKRGRPAVGRMNSREPLSRYAQLTKRFQAVPERSNWIDLLVEDKRASILDQVAAKLDVSAWFASLSWRMKHIAKDLADGFTTSEVAAKYRSQCQPNFSTAADTRSILDCVSVRSD